MQNMVVQRVRTEAGPEGAGGGLREEGGRPSTLTLDRHTAIPSHARFPPVLERRLAFAAHYGSERDANRRARPERVQKQAYVRQAPRYASTYV